MSDLPEKDDGSIKCRLCGCRFFSENDYMAHMDAFGVERHLEKFKAAHHNYYYERR